MAAIIRFRFILTALWLLGHCSASANGEEMAESAKEVRGVCCAGVIHARTMTSSSLPNGRSSQMCCGNSTYDADDSICCWNGTFYQLPLPTSAAIDVDTTLMSANSSNKDDGDLVVANFRMDLAYLACCGDHVFDLRDNVCCQETVLPKSSDVRTVSCCGRRLYDVIDEICCGSGEAVAARNATAVDNPSLVQCCGSKPFDPRTHLCCGGQPLANPEGPDGRCCDGKVYGQRTEVCCSGEIHQRDSPTMVCCGQLPFDWERDRCCDSQVFKSVGKSVECCGNTTFDTRRSKCCHGIVRQLATSSNDGEDGNAQLECCGDVLHDTATDRCCGGVVVVNASRDDVGCCRTVAFDPFEGLCCHGLVVPNKDESRSCCGTAGKTYDTRRELCCNGRPVALRSSTIDTNQNENVNPSNRSSPTAGAFKTTPTNLCCASAAFDPMTQGCCNGVVFTL